MPRFRVLAAALAGGLVGLAAGQGAAQSGPPARGGPIGTSVDLQVVHTGDTEFDAVPGRDGGGSFSSTRFVADGQIAWIRDARTSLGLSLGGAITDYSFSGDTPALWDDTREVSVALPLRFGVGARGSAFVIPTVRFAAEDGADLQDGRSAGLIGVVVWRINDRLTIGPGFGAFEELSGDIDVFPILGIDWRVTDRVSVSTLRGVGSTQGPGLGVFYSATRALDLGLAFRFDGAEFRLSDDNAVPGGVGRVDGTPIVATVAWSPNPGLRASAFAGAVVGGELEVYDSDERLVSRRDYDPAPILGGQVTFRF